MGKVCLLPIPVPLEVEVQLEHSSIKDTFEAILTAVLPLSVHDLEGNICRQQEKGQGGKDAVSVRQ